MHPKNYIITFFVFFISSKLFAQTENSFVVKINNDTLQDRYVVKVNPGDNVIKLTDRYGLIRLEYPLDSLKYFYFKNTGWVLAEKMENLKGTVNGGMFDKQKDLFDLLSRKRKEPLYYNIFFPVSREDETYNLGSWGSVMGTRTLTKVKVSTKGLNSWYEYDFTHYSGSSYGLNSMMYIYNDNLGLTKIFYLDTEYYLKAEVEAISEVLTAYTSNRPNLLNPFLAEKKFDYAHIHKFLKKYFSK